MEKLVTFYRSYGYLDKATWHVPLRAWVHEASSIATVLQWLPAQLGVAQPDELAIFERRTRDFVADSESFERVTVRFDHDPARRDRHLSRESGSRFTDRNGLIDGSLTLPRDEADVLLKAQGSSRGWLTFTATSAGHRGTGAIQLIPPTGVSVVSDIDDTVKVTNIPAGGKEVVLNTFFRPFVAAPDMAALYGEIDAAFHYVSAGPFQLYEPIVEFLLSREAGFPDGTFHPRVFTTNPLSMTTWQALGQLLLDPDATFKHKVHEISTLMDRFTERTFILIGDSGEKDPEIYRHVWEQFGKQVQEIRIRDVTDDRTHNPSRLDGMTIIAAPTVAPPSASS